MKRIDDESPPPADAPPADGLSTRPVPLDDVPRGSKTIHVVEATSDELLRLYDLLCGAGYHVATFSNPLDALDSVGRVRPAVAVVSADLPEMDGLELLFRIRRASPLTRVILTSADPGRPTYKEVMDAGGETLIHNPFDPGVLLQAVLRASTGMRGGAG